METVQSLDYSQRFPEIDIESEHQTETLKDASFDESMEKLQGILNEMSQSRFYKNIKVHFGAKTNENTSYIEEHYEKQLENLNRLLVEEKQRLKGIVQAENQEKLQEAQLTHQINILQLRKRYQDVRHSNYYPCIFVQAQRKGPLFGNIQQDINRHGAGTLSANIGYRSPFLRYDTMMFNMEWPLQTKINKRYYQFGVSWNNTFKKWGDFFTKYSIGNQPTYQNVDTHTHGFSFGVQQNTKRYELQYIHRIPFLHKHVMNEINRQFYRPSNKCSLRFTNVLENTLKYNEVTEGTFSQFKSQLGLPFIGNANFLRLEYSYRRFFDTYPLRKYLDNQLAKKFLWKSTVQTNFNVSTIAEYGSRHFINELLQPIDMRGFESYKKPTPSYANLKGSIKFNIHNYPLLNQANVVSFLYCQMGLCFLKGQRILNPYFLKSSGLGVSVNLGPAQLQLLCNLMQYQNKQLREPVGFQFRFSMND